MIPLSKLKPAKYNPRIMTEAQLDHLAKSMETKGIAEPIVINKDFTIIGGHQRFRVLTEKTDKKETICAVLDLTKDEEKELNLSLNQITGYWDEDMRNELVYQLRDRDIPGFDDEEKQQILLQREMMFENEGKYDPDDDEDLQAIFSRNEKVPAKVEEPEAQHRKDQIVFYTDNFEDYDFIRKAFGTSRKGELDVKKLIEIAKKANEKSAE